MSPFTACLVAEVASRDDATRPTLVTDPTIFVSFTSTREERNVIAATRSKIRLLQ